MSRSLKRVDKRHGIEIHFAGPRPNGLSTHLYGAARLRQPIATVAKMLGEIAKYCERRWGVDEILTQECTSPAPDNRSPHVFQQADSFAEAISSTWPCRCAPACACSLSCSKAHPVSPHLQSYSWVARWASPTYTTQILLTRPIR